MASNAIGFGEITNRKCKKDSNLNQTKTQTEVLCF